MEGAKTTSRRLSSIVGGKCFNAASRCVKSQSQEGMPALGQPPGSRRHKHAPIHARVAECAARDSRELHLKLAGSSSSGSSKTSPSKKQKSGRKARSFRQPIRQDQKLN